MADRLLRRTVASIGSRVENLESNKYEVVDSFLVLLCQEDRARKKQSPPREKAVRSFEELGNALKHLQGRNLLCLMCYFMQTRLAFDRN